MSERLLFRILIVLFCLYKAWCFYYFPLHFTDSDQTVMWQAAKDFSQGHFHHPFWYGQAYSSNAESLSAVPFIWLQVPVQVAVPLASSLFSAVSVLFLAAIAKERNGYHSASAVLLLSFAFPHSFWQITMLSRGFIQGIVFVAAGIFILSRRPCFGWMVLSGFLITSGLLQNINAIFLLLPALVLVPLNKDSIRSFTGTLYGSIFAVLLFWFLQSLVQEGNIIHAKPALTLSADTWWQNINNLDSLFLHVTPSWPGAFSGLLLICIGLVSLAKGDLRIRIAVLFLLLSILLSAGLSKTADGTENIFYSKGRFFAAVPFALLLLMAYIKVKPSFKYSNTIILLLFLSVTSIAAAGFRKASTPEKFGNGYVPVAISDINSLKRTCFEVYDLAKLNNVGLIISGDHHRLELITCGCPSIIPSFPTAVRPKFERRAWLWRKLKNKKSGNLIYLDNWNSFDTLKNRLPIIVETRMEGGYIIPSDGKTPLQAMRSLFPAEQF